MWFPLRFPNRRPRTRRPQQRPRNKARSLRCEPLEQRTLLAVDLGWAIGFGGASHDLANAMASDATGNVYVTGEFRGVVDFDPSVLGQCTLDSTAEGGSPSTSDVFVAKYDPAGALVWAKQFGGANNDAGSILQLDRSGNIYVAGGFTGRVTFGTQQPIDDTQGGQFLVKLDGGTGEVQWVRQKAWQLADVAIDAGGSIYVVGTYRPGSQGGDAMAWKLDASGTTLLDKQLTRVVRGGLSWPGSAEAKAIAIQGNRVYVTGGYSETVDFDLDATHGQDVDILISTKSWTARTRSGDAFVLELTTDLAYRWAGGMGGQSGDSGDDIAADATGVYIVGACQSVQGSDFDPGSGSYSLPTTGAFLVKLDANNNFLWAKSMQTPYFELNGGPARIALRGADLYVLGSFDETADFDTQNVYADNRDIRTAQDPGGRDVFVVKWTTDGDFRWVATMGNSSTEYSDRQSGLAFANDGGLYFAGSFVGTPVFNPDGSAPITSNGLYDAFVAKLSQTPDPAMISINDVSGTEGNSGTKDFVFTVTRSGDLSQAVTVGYTLGPIGSAPATLGEDYDYVDSVHALTIPAWAATGTITVHVIGDAFKEPNETFAVNLSLSNPPPGATIIDGQGVGTIVNDDGGKPKGSSGATSSSLAGTHAASSAVRISAVDFLMFDLASQSSNHKQSAKTDHDLLLAMYDPAACL